MARSHVCLNCGIDIARHRGTWDPSFGREIIVCPTCRAAVARRPAPLQASRPCRRALAAGSAAAVNALLIAGGLFGLALAVVGLTSAIINHDGTLRALLHDAMAPATTLDDDTWIPLLVAGISAPVSGILLALAAAHLRRRSIALAVVGVAFVTHAAAYGIAFLLRLLDGRDPKMAFEFLPVTSLTVPSVLVLALPTFTLTAGTLLLLSASRPRRRRLVMSRWRRLRRRRRS